LTINGTMVATMCDVVRASQRDFVVVNVTDAIEAFRDRGGRPVGASDESGHKTCGCLIAVYTLQYMVLNSILLDKYGDS